MMSLSMMIPADIRFATISSAAPRPVPSPFMNRLRINVGSRGVLPGAGRIVDLHGNQRRSAIVETAIEQFFEMRFVTHPCAVCDTGAARYRDDIGQSGASPILPSM